MEDLSAYRRELAIELDEGQLARLNRIWSTDTCPRRQYHRIMREIEELPVHFSSWKGGAVHRLIEYELAGEEPYIHWDEFPDQREKVEAEADDHISKFRRWMEESELDFSEAILEAKYEIELPLGYTKVRKIDVVGDGFQIDWKTGKKRNTKDARIGLAAGWDATKAAGEGECDPENLLLVFTGGEVAEELYPFRNKKTPFGTALEDMREQDRMNIFYREQIKAGEVPPCKVSYFCGSCRYRHVCRGV